MAALDFNTAFCFYGGSYLFFIFQEDFQPLSSLCAREEGIKTTMDYFRYLGTMLPLAVLVNPLMGLVQCLGGRSGLARVSSSQTAGIYETMEAVLLTG